jgi:hypothetical protein
LFNEEDRELDNKRFLLMALIFRLLLLNHEIYARAMEAEKQSAPELKPHKGKKKATNDNQSSLFFK